MGAEIQGKTQHGFPFKCLKCSQPQLNFIYSQSVLYPRYERIIQYSTCNVRIKSTNSPLTTKRIRLASNFFRGEKGQKVKSRLRYLLSSARTFDVRLSDLRNPWPHLVAFLPRTHTHTHTYHINIRSMTPRPSGCSIVRLVFMLRKRVQV